MAAALAGTTPAAGAGHRTPWSWASKGLVNGGSEKTGHGFPQWDKKKTKDQLQEQP